MTLFRRPRGAVALVIPAMVGLALTAMPTAQADSGEDTSYPWFPDQDDPLVSGPIPDGPFEIMADCPTLEERLEILDGHGLDGETESVCINLKVTDGELKLGETVASVPSFGMTVFVAVESDGEGGFAEPIIVPVGDGGSPEGVDVFGDPSGLGNSPLGSLVGPLTTVTATPELGELSVAGDAPTSLITWLGGAERDIALNVPLSITLENVLLGAECTIPEFDMQLTNGTTEPPSGVEPITGSDGTPLTGRWHIDGYPPEDFWDPGPRFQFTLREGATLVDNGFAVPGASNCGPLVGSTVDGLGLAELNAFNAFVNSEAGLPSEAGNNHSSLTVDAAVGLYAGGLGLSSPAFTEDPRYGG